MRRVEGDTGVALLGCTNPVKGKWRVRRDVQEYEDGNASYMEGEFGHKPTDEEICSMVMGWYSGQTDAVILSDFNCNGAPVWLSGENQFNYKSTYDLAVQTGGGTLPVTFKFGADAQPHYHAFGTLKELAGFYTAVMKHIQSAPAEGRKKRDSFDLGLYRVEQLKDVSLRGRDRKKPLAC